MMKGKLPKATRAQLIGRMLGRKTGASVETAPGAPVPVPGVTARAVSEDFTRFDRHPGYQKLLIPKVAADWLGVRNPFFIAHDGIAGAATRIDGRDYVNFANYNYLGLAGHPAVNRAARDAIDRYGTSASASRLVAGERPVHRELELALAGVYGVEDCVIFVSGHATNVSTIGYLFGPRDLVVHDSLIHNSVLEGIRLSGAARRAFRHNDMAGLNTLLTEIRGEYERVLIVVEGHYSMDGDVCDLPALVEIKERHQAFLMVDEAHSLGVLGKTGRGVHEHFGMDGRTVDIWMGTMSKTLAGCGGYIAGEEALVAHLKYAAPGFVYSVGMAPPLAAASLAALGLMLAEPKRVAQLREVAAYCLERMQAMGINTGRSQGHAVIPAILGSSLKAARLSNALFEEGINVQPIIHPAVEEKAARLRFFLSSLHSTDDVDYTLDVVKRFIAQQ